MKKTNLVRIISRELKAFIKLKGDVTKDNYSSISKRIGGQLDAVYTIEKSCHLKTFSPARTCSNIRKLFDLGYKHNIIDTTGNGDNMICGACERDVPNGYFYSSFKREKATSLCSMCHEIFHAIRLDVEEQIENKLAGEVNE